jgi:hypothetical protein
MWGRGFAAVVLGGVLLACVWWLHQPGAVEEPPNRDEATTSPTLQTPSVVSDGDAVADRDDAAREPAMIELRDASQTFRNSTLLIAIRRAGLYCADVVAAYESADGVWLASCSDVISYIVTLRGAEQFDVHAIGYVDSVAPVPGQSPQRPSIEPEPLRK